MVRATSGDRGVRTLWFGLAALAAAGTAVAVPAHASPVTVVNGGFEQLQTPANGSSEIGSRFPGQNVVGWTTSGYNFVFLPGTADTTGANSEFGAGIELWGPGSAATPGNAVANGLPASSPAGGNFIANDGAFNVAPLQQTLTGLSPGSVAQVSFYYAGAQQYTFRGATTDAWTVSLGSESHSTAVLPNVDQGFTGWRQATLSFVVTNASEVLSFLAVGTPNGLPPFSLLDGVTVNQVPEPSTVALLAVGAGLAGFAARRRAASRA